MRELAKRHVHRMTSLMVDGDMHGITAQVTHQFFCGIDAVPLSNHEIPRTSREPVDMQRNIKTSH